jgi:hypothetical protein
MISYMTFDFPSVGEDFFVVTDVEARAVEPRLGATNDNASDRSMESDEASNYADQFQDQPDLDSRGRINDRDLDVLEAVLNLIPKCITAPDFQRLSDLIPHMEPVHVATRTVQEAIAVSFDTISYMISYLPYDIIL